MSRVHWLGTGLSSVPGLRKLINKGYDTYIWNRSVEKAQSLLGDISDKIYELNFDELEKKISAGDILVSMLPANLHLDIAKLCLKKNSNFVSSSYISDEILNLNKDALDKKIVLLNEVGLDPGIDHLMAHSLVKNYKESPIFDEKNTIEFFSFCGGLPKEPNDFCYKFSWSPMGVLKALKNTARSIENFKTVNTIRPWDNVDIHEIPSNNKEKFEVYPNRDSIPFIDQYEFGRNWNIKRFVRGTLRNLGWRKAWKDIFDNMDKMNIESDNEKLEKLSENLWRKYSYKDNEKDRVVLNVSLKASNENFVIFHQSYLLDAWGDEQSSAMARLVSFPVSLAVEAVLKDKIPYGVSAAPKSNLIVNKWLSEIKKETQIFNFIDYS